MATASKTKIQPLADRVLIKPEEAESKTQSGIFLPESAKEKPLQGKIISVGPGALNDDGKRTALAVKKGDTVMFGQYAGQEIDIDGKKHMIMRENELLGILS